jgi:hypothetical protein
MPKATLTGEEVCEVLATLSSSLSNRILAALPQSEFRRLEGALERMNGLVKHRRNVITILDRAGLEAAACECYAFVRDARGIFDR